MSQSRVLQQGGATAIAFIAAITLAGCGTNNSSNAAAPARISTASPPRPLATTLAPQDLVPSFSGQLSVTGSKSISAAYSHRATLDEGVTCQSLAAKGAGNGLYAIPGPDNEQVNGKTMAITSSVAGYGGPKTYNNVDQFGTTHAILDLSNTDPASFFVTSSSSKQQLTVDTQDGGSFSVTHLFAQGNPGSPVDLKLTWTCAMTPTDH